MLKKKTKKERRQNKTKNKTRAVSKNKKEIFEPKKIFIIIVEDLRPPDRLRLIH